jgi:hypothetical protein
VVAHVLLRQLELRRELAHADRRARTHEHVENPQPVPIRDRAQQPLQLERFRLAKRTPANRSAAIDRQQSNLCARGCVSASTVTNLSPLDKAADELEDGR